MSESEGASEIPLKHAIALLCDQAIVEEMLNVSSSFSPYALRSAGWYPYDVLRTSETDREYFDDADQGYQCDRLRHAWQALYEDFRQRIQDEKIYLNGVQMKPARHTFRTPIPNAWGHDLMFDLFKDEVTVRGSQERYIGVKASQVPPVATTPDVSIAAPDLKRPVTPEWVAELSDDEVLLLLEDHARRVVENDGPLIQPGKVSLMPIIRRKMQRRIETGEVENTLAAEAQHLANWIATKVPSHQVPTAGAIKNAMRPHYPRRKA